LGGTLGGWCGTPGINSAECLAAGVCAEGMARRYSWSRLVAGDGGHRVTPCVMAEQRRVRYGAGEGSDDGIGLCQQYGSWLAHAGHPGSGIRRERSLSPQRPLRPAADVTRVAGIPPLRVAALREVVARAAGGGPVTRSRGATPSR
jgi:hypothetical protein